ncbi:MAG TPA: hypothetical protein VE868_10830 [Balneolaceae bacterium]|nr:hypothetical protein [Balneolaceae bacterium]
MADYENKGILFKNDYKNDNPKAPDYKGKINFDGEEKELAAWVKKGKNGKFLSLSVSEPYESNAPSKQSNDSLNDSMPDMDDVDSDLPF